jgi:hypothetical protein
MTRLLKPMLASLLIVPAAVQAQVTPGQWQTTVKVTSMEMPGAPPQVAEMMKKSAAGGAHTVSHCVTPQQAAQGPREMIKQNKSCKFNKFSMSGGKFSTEMTCLQEGGTMTVRSAGSYGPNSFKATSAMTMSGRMRMASTSEVTGRRLGPCTGK